MRKAKAVNVECRIGGIRRIAVFERRDHRLAAAGIAGNRVHRHRPVGRDKACTHQRADKRQKAGGIATGVGNAGRLRDLFALARFHFGKAVHPVGRNAVRGRRIHDAHGRILDKGHGLARGIVGQAEHDGIGAVQCVTAGTGVLA